MKNSEIRLNGCLNRGSARLAAVFALAVLSACNKQAPVPAPGSDPAANGPAAPAAVTAQPAPADARVFFVGIKDGDTVTNPFTVGFGASGLEVAPAGTIAPGTGHHHLIVDADLPPAGAPLPADDHVRHFGKGQTETQLTLPPGSHTLQLEFADGAHVPFAPPIVSDKITITVKDAS